MLESDRRVLGNLSEPVSLPMLIGALMSDAHAPFDRAEGYEFVQEDVCRVLAKLVRRGLVVELGRHSTAKSMLGALRESADAIEVGQAKLAALRSRLESGRDVRLHVGELYVMSKLGFDALHAPLDEQG